MIRIDWAKIHYTPSAGLQARFSDVFSKGLGTFKDVRLGLK